jgi:hypothetical protein
MFLTTSRLVLTLFVLLFLGSLVYAHERVLFSDASYILFRIINSGGLQIQEHRYGSFITQGVPLIAAKFHLPISTIVVLYSVSFHLFYLAVICLLLYVFRQKELAVLMSLYFLLFVSDTYFWMNNEVHQGIAWMFLFFGVLLYMGEKRTAPWIVYPVFASLAFLSLYTHPLVVFPAAFLWLFLLSRRQLPYSRKQIWMLTSLFIILALSKILVSTGASSHYDVHKLNWLTHPSLRNISEAFGSSLAKEILVRTIRFYWLVPLLFVAGLYAIARQKLYGQLWLTLGFSFVYFLAICFTYRDFTPFYMESELMPATIILTAPFVYSVFSSLKHVAQVVCLGLVFVIRITAIYQSSGKWTERKEWLYATLNTMRNQRINKGLIEENQDNSQKLIMNWGTPTESIIASALYGEKPQRTFVIDKRENLSSRLPDRPIYMISCFENVPGSSLNERYFSIDTTTHYKLVRLQ